MKMSFISKANLTSSFKKVKKVTKYGGGKMSVMLCNKLWTISTGVEVRIVPHRIHTAAFMH